MQMPKLILNLVFSNFVMQKDRNYMLKFNSTLTSDNCLINNIENKQYKYYTLINGYNNINLTKIRLLNICRRW